MSREKYYILYPSEHNMYCNIYYTTNPLILTQFIRQNENNEYNVIEIIANDIFDASEKLEKKYNMSIYNDNELTVYTTHTGLSIITSPNELSEYDLYTVACEINRIFINFWCKLKVLIPYFRDEYREFLKIFALLFYKYICRQVLACDCDLNSDLSYETKKLLGFNTNSDEYIDNSEVIDDILMVYILEFGWGCFD